MSTAERIIRGAGTPEAAWQAWSALADTGRVNWEHLLPAGTRCVVIAPHPDDEVLACGGVVALHAERGDEVLVIGVTDGEASHAGLPGWDPQRLGQVRRDERLCGLDRLGAAQAAVVRLAFADGEVAAHVARLAAALQRHLRPGDVVVTTWRLDGHPDHEACGDAAALACADVGCRLLEAPVWMWHWAEPADARVPWHRLRGVALPDAAVARRRFALMAHATQWQPRDAHTGPVLTDGIAQRLDRRVEFFFG